MRLSILLPLCWSAGLYAQRPAGDAALTRGDTTAAIAAYERAESDAQAQYRAGRLLLSRHVAGLVRSDALDRARAAFRRATELAPDSAGGWLGLAETYRAAGDVLSRLQVGGLLDRAWQVSQANPSSAGDAVAYQAARWRWERFEGQTHRYLFSVEAQTLAPEIMLGEWDDLTEFFRRQVRPDPGDPGAEDLAAAEERLRSSLAVNPRHLDAAGLLAVALGERDRWAEADELTRALVRAAPDSGGAWALRGLVLVRVGRWAEAQQAFDRALTMLPPEDASALRSLVPVLRPRDADRWQRMSPEERQQLERLYWIAAQPSYLDSLNQVRLEHLARAVYVEHRWKDPLRGVQGRDTERGRVYLRYGPPDVWATFGGGRLGERDPDAAAAGATVLDAAASLETQRTPVVWLYERSQLRFVFSLNTAFARDQFGGDFREVFRRAQDIFPARYDNVPIVADMDTVLVQFAQFRGARPGTTDLGIFAFMPIGRMARGADAATLPLRTAAILKNALLEDIHRAESNDPVTTANPRQVELRSWRFNLPTGEYLMRIEGHLGGVDRRARSTSVLGLRAYPGDTLRLSDLLVADAVAPRDSSYLSWRDFFIRPSAGRFAPGDPIALLWETYGLTPDSTGAVHYTIELAVTVRQVDRRGLAARILGGIGDAIGLSAQGDDQVALEYTRRGPQAERQVDWLTVGLDAAPEGLYTIAITVTDRVSGRSSTQFRSIRVTRGELVR